jgi:hypothetical protein
MGKITIIAIRNKILRHLEEQYPDFTYTKIVGGIINVYKIYNPIVTNQIAQIKIEQSITQNCYLLSLINSRTHNTEIFNFTYINGQINLINND